VSELDLLTVGRVNFDLYAQQHDVAFRDVTSWDSMVGGSPANVAVAAARLGLRARLFSAVGDDLVGEWVLRALERAGVATDFVHRKHGPHTSLALRAQLAPDHPLAFYRHDPADIHLTLDDAAKLPLDSVRALLLSADSFARGSTAETARWILGQAAGFNRTVYIDLDLRHVNWPDLRTYAEVLEPVAEHADVVLGTADEFAALLRLSSNSDAIAVVAAARAKLANGAPRVIVIKLGAQGATVLADEQTIDVPALRVREACTIGAGDSFAAGLIYARLAALDWLAATRFGSACAAITVSRYGCSNGFPTAPEVASLTDGAELVKGAT
jgi:5-dehydro-2-deoxygluconokinase